MKNLIQFTETLVSIAQRCIPKNKIKTKQNRRWFNDKCKEAIRLRRKALREFEKEPTTENLKKFKQLRAKAQKTKENKQESWKNYISKLSSATKTKSVWDMIKKIAGKFHTHAIIYFSKNNKITNKKDIADELAITFSKNTLAKNGNEKFAKFKQKAEKLKLNFKSNNTESYNLPFTIEELKDAIQTSRNTAIGPDEIHYEFLKHSPKRSLDYLLTIFYDIWMNGTFPESWKIATIIPIPKLEKTTQTHLTTAQ